MSAKYSGFVRRADDGKGIVGELRDSWGWCIAIVGTPGEQDGVRGYILAGTLGEPPEALRIPIIDDEPPAGAQPQ
jgi:hypothetical protein